MFLVTGGKKFIKYKGTQTFDEFLSLSLSLPLFMYRHTNMYVSTNNRFVSCSLSVYMYI